MIKDAQTYQQADKDFSARHEAKQSLEAYVSSVESTSASSLLEPPSVAETPLQAPCPGAPSLAPLPLPSTLLRSLCYVSIT